MKFCFNILFIDIATGGFMGMLNDQNDFRVDDPCGVQAAEPNECRRPIPTKLYDLGQVEVVWEPAICTQWAYLTPKDKPNCNEEILRDVQSWLKESKTYYDRAGEEIRHRPGPLARRPGVGERAERQVAELDQARLDRERVAGAVGRAQQVDGLEHPAIADQGRGRRERVRRGRHFHPMVVPEPRKRWQGSPPWGTEGRRTGVPDRPDAPLAHPTR